MKVISSEKKRGPAASLALFKLTDDEWQQIHKNFWKLCRHQAKSLLNMNTKGSHTDDQDDIEQEMYQSMIIAAMYHKRQCFIDSCFNALANNVKDKGLLEIISKLESLWRPEASDELQATPRRRFGEHQEKTLYRLVNSCLPSALRPSPNTPFKFNEKFERYCKANTWNRIKTLGRKITKERTLRSGMASLSSFNYLVHSDGEPAEADLVHE